MTVFIGGMVTVVKGPQKGNWKLHANENRSGDACRFVSHGRNLRKEIRREKGGCGWEYIRIFNDYGPYFERALGQIDFH